MRIALLSDIHGNIRALNAVLSDARWHGIDRYVFLGDMVFMGLAPQACLDTTMELEPLICIKGNTDANLEEISTFIPTTPFEEHLRDLIVDCDSRLNDAAKQTLAGWPATVTFNMGQVEVLFCHGSPYSASEKLLPGDATGVALQRKLEQESAQLIVCGHTHQSGDFFIGQKRVINPGAVGYSFDGDPQASYAIIEDVGSSIVCEIRKIAYDIDAYKQEIRDQLDAACTLSKSLLHVLEHGLPKTP
jgi:putative phosphoesterase